MDEERRHIPRHGAMFTDRSLAKADMATNLAIQLLADGGWSALTLRNLARAGNVTPQAIAAWFPSATVMRATIAGRYGERWLRERMHQARIRTRGPLGSTEAVTPAQVTVALLPVTWLDEAFARIWLTIIEASRWDEGAGAAVEYVRDRERGMVLDLVADVRCTAGNNAGREDLADLVLALTDGLCAARTAPRNPMSAERAEQVVAAAFSGAPT